MECAGILTTGERRAEVVCDRCGERGAVKVIAKLTGDGLMLYCKGCKCSKLLPFTLLDEWRGIDVIYKG